MKRTVRYIFICIFFLLLAAAGKGCYGQEQNNSTTGNEIKNTQETAESNEIKPQDTKSPVPSPNGSDTSTHTEDGFDKLAPTTDMSFEELVGDNGDYSDVTAYPEAGTYKLVVNEYYQVVTAFKKDSKGEYTDPARYMICSTGAAATPSPSGTFKMGEDHIRFGKFETFDVYGQYWSQITRNIYFHSLLYTKRDANTFTKSSYHNLGKRASHGCIRLLVPDARWIYYNAAPGTEVEIIKGKKDTMMEEIKKKLTRAKIPSKRPKLEKGQIPVTEPWPGYDKKEPGAAAQK